MLSECHGIEICLRQLKRRLREWNLSSRLEKYDINIIKSEIVELLDEPDSKSGYRSIWHTLQRRGIMVPHLVVQKLLKKIEPEGVEFRKTHRRSRRQYYYPGPNRAAWHADGYFFSV